eukprot:744681-Amphidinium_carterae.1
MDVAFEPAAAGLAAAAFALALPLAFGTTTTGTAATSAVSTLTGSRACVSCSSPGGAMGASTRWDCASSRAPC